MNKHRIIGLVALLLLTALALVGFMTHGFGMLDKPPEPVKLYGNVDIRQVDLAFRVPGRIATMAFDEGTKVPRGAALAQRDRPAFSPRMAIAAQARHGSCLHACWYTNPVSVHHLVA